MGSRWDGFQNKPKRKRRVAIDFYEFCTFIVFVSLGLLGLLIMIKKPDGWFDHVSDERNAIITIGFLITGLALVKFDSSARSRAAKQFHYDLTEYETLRTNWLELQASKLEMEKQYSMQYMNMNNEVIPAPPEETKELVEIKES